MKIKLMTSWLMFIMGFARLTSAQSWEKVINLNGSWKFSIGDDMSWTKPNYDDSKWDRIRVPSAWEDEGYSGYDGYAWYRKHIKISSSLQGQNLKLELGRIDDVDQVFLNGNLIGSTGIFPPHYITAYSEWRSYYLPEKYLNFDKDNVIAVRVYDSQLRGGITDGDIRIIEEKNSMKLDLDLSGVWKFNLGDDPDWKMKKIDDKKWKDIIVPNYWEAQGYSNYDGFAWYRYYVTVPNNLVNKKLVLVLGRIDDIDEAYINGTIVGSTGDMNDGDPISFNDNEEYKKIRGYYIPDGLIDNKEITIAIRVFDGYNVGGIYEGPIGLITQEKYAQYWKDQKKYSKRKSFWSLFFD